MLTFLKDRHIIHFGFGIHFDLVGINVIEAYFLRGKVIL